MELEERGNIRDLLNLLCKTGGPGTDVFYTKEMRLKPNVTVTLNGRFIIHLNWLDTTLSEGDKVAIFTLHCGG